MQSTEENYEKLRDKEVAGDPSTSHSCNMRKQCKPKGPVGYLLEMIRLNAATLVENKTIYQCNQSPLNIEHAPLSASQPDNTAICSKEPHDEGKPRPKRNN